MSKQVKLKLISTGYSMATWHSGQCVPSLTGHSMAMDTGPLVTQSPRNSVSWDSVTGHSVARTLSRRALSRFTMTAQSHVIGHLYTNMTYIYILSSTIN